MDVPAIKQAGAAPLKSMLQNISNLYPVRDSKQTAANTDLSRVQAYLLQHTAHTLVDIRPKIFQKRPAVWTLAAMPQDPTSLGRQFYGRGDIMAQYETSLTRTFEALHPGRPSADKARGLAQDLIKFEKKMVAIMPSDDDLDNFDQFTTKMSLADTDKLAPVLGIGRIVKQLAPPGHGVGEINTMFPDVLEKLAEMVAETSAETMQAYFYNQILGGYYNLVMAPEVQAITDSSGAPVADRSRLCRDMASDPKRLGLITARFYAKKYFSQGSTDRMKAMFQYLKAQFAKSIKAQSWLQESTRKYALEKLEDMGARIGYPQTGELNMDDPVSAGSYYTDVGVSASYFENTLVMQRANVVRSWQKLGDPSRPR